MELTWDPSSFYVHMADGSHYPCLTRPLFTLPLRRQKWPIICAPTYAPHCAAYPLIQSGLQENSPRLHAHVTLGSVQTRSSCELSLVRRGNAPTVSTKCNATMRILPLSSQILSLLHVVTTPSPLSCTCRRYVGMSRHDVTFSADTQSVTTLQPF